MNNAEKLADSLGTAHIRQRIPDSFAQKEKAEAVRHIEKELYTLPSAVSNCHEGLIMTEAAGIYNDRGDYSMSFQENIVHASDSPETAAIELTRFFKPEEIFDYKQATFDYLYANDEY